MNPTPRHVERALHERVEIVPYDPAWPGLFAEEVARLRAALPAELIGRIEHFGSTAVPGLAAKPIIDMLVEVCAMEDVAQRIAAEHPDDRIAYAKAKTRFVRAAMEAARTEVSRPGRT